MKNELFVLMGSQQGFKGSDLVSERKDTVLKTMAACELLREGLDTLLLANPPTKELPENRVIAGILREKFSIDEARLQLQPEVERLDESIWNATEAAKEAGAEKIILMTVLSQMAGVFSHFVRDANEENIAVEWLFVEDVIVKHHPQEIVPIVAHYYDERDGQRFNAAKIAALLASRKSIAGALI